MPGLAALLRQFSRCPVELHMLTTNRLLNLTAVLLVSSSILPGVMKQNYHRIFSV